MDWRFNKFKTMTGEALSSWQSLDKNWWTISYTSVSWAYSSQNLLSRFQPAAKPPFYHEDLVSSVEKGVDAPSRSCPKAQVDQVESTTLNHLLCGVQCVEEALAPYEHAVGFFAPEDYRGFAPKREVARDISKPVVDEDLARSKAQWERLEEDLLAPVVKETPSKSSLFFTALSTQSSPSSIADDFDHSGSVPSTPQLRTSEIAVDIKEAPPLRASPDRHLNAGRPLNATASSFVPVFNPTLPKTESYFGPVSDSYLDFPPLPSFNRDVPLNKLGSDPTIIPPFLQRLSQTQSTPLPSRRRANASKTREIIDRLRLSSQARAAGNLSPAPATPDPLEQVSRLKSLLASASRSRNTTPAPAQDEEGDGWVDLSDHPSVRTEDRARETRNLFLSFTKRRSASTSPSPSQTLSSAGHQSQDSLIGQDIEFPRTLSPTPTTPPATMSPTCSLPSVSSMHDGWIEGPAITSPSKSPSAMRAQTDPARSRHRKGKSSENSASTCSSAQSLPSLGVVAGQPFVPAVPTPAQMPFNPPAFPYPMPVVAPPAIPFAVAQPPRLPFRPTLPVPAQMMTPMVYASYMHQLQMAQMHMGGIMAATSGPARRAARLMAREIDSVF